MGYEVPDLVVYQGRWFTDELNEYGVRWSPWKIIEEWEYLIMKDHIDNGVKYQIRILKQIHIQGFGVDYYNEHPEIELNPGL